MKKIIYIIISISLGALLLFFFDQKKSYYFNNDHTKCITIWKRLGGNCYIVPREYHGIFVPKYDYMVTTNDNGLIVVWDKTSKYDIIVMNNYGMPIQFVVKSIKVRYFNFNERKKFNENYSPSGQINYPLEYLLIDIKENYAFVNGKKI
jgi:hypothetical protein